MNPDFTSLFLAPYKFEFAKNFRQWVFTTVFTLGARDFSSAVSAQDVSAFGQHRKFPPHARKTSGTQGTLFYHQSENMACTNCLTVNITT